LPSLPKSRIGELIADTVSAVVVSSACGCGATGDDGAMRVANRSIQPTPGRTP